MGQVLQQVINGKPLTASGQPNVIPEDVVTWIFVKKASARSSSPIFSRKRKTFSRTAFCWLPSVSTWETTFAISRLEPAIEVAKNKKHWRTSYVLPSVLKPLGTKPKCSPMMRTMPKSRLWSRQPNACGSGRHPTRRSSPNCRWQAWLVCDHRQESRMTRWWGWTQRSSKVSQNRKFWTFLFL